MNLDSIISQEPQQPKFDSTSIIIQNDPNSFDDSNIDIQILNIIARMIDVETLNEMKIALWEYFQMYFAEEIEYRGDDRDAIFDVWKLYGR